MSLVFPLVWACAPAPAPLSPDTNVRFVLDGPVDGVGLLLAHRGSDEAGVPFPASMLVPAAQFSTNLQPIEDAFFAQLYEAGNGDPVGIYATYDILLWSDQDGDHERSEEEPIVGAGGVMLFASTVYSDDKAERQFGFPNGWSAVDHPMTAVPATVQTPSDSSGLQGTWTGPATRMALVPVTWSARQGVSVPWDEAVQGAWAVGVDGTPPEDHQLNWGWSVPDGSALYNVVRYRDDDASGSYTEGDTPLGVASDCTRDGDTELMLAWLAPALDRHVGRRLEGRQGWHLVAADASNVYPVTDPLREVTFALCEELE